MDKLKILAQLVKQLGIGNSSQDKDLVYVTPQEERMLSARGGSGRVDPTTGLQHYDDGDGTMNSDGSFGEGEGTGTTSGQDGTMNADGTFGNEGGPASSMDGAVNPNSADPNVESSGVMAGTKGAQTEEEQNTSQQGGKAGGGVTADEAARANAEYESIYGPTDSEGNAYTGAEAINEAYNSYASDFNTAGNVGAFIGTLFDALLGAARGSSAGPLGAALSSIYGGLTGRTGDTLGQAGRDSVASSLAEGTWGISFGAPGEDSGNGQMDENQVIAQILSNLNTSNPNTRTLLNVQDDLSRYNTQLTQGVPSWGTPGTSTSLSTRDAGSSRELGPLTSGLLKRYLEMQAQSLPAATGSWSA